MSKVKINIYYPNGVAILDNLFQIFYFYENNFLLDSNKWHDLSFETGNFLLEYEDQYLHLNAINLNKLLYFLIEGLCLNNEKKDIFKHFTLSDEHHRDFFLRISYPKKDLISISRVEFNEYKDYNYESFIERGDSSYSSYILKEGIEVNKVSFQITLPISYVTEEIIRCLIYQQRWTTASRNNYIPTNKELESNLKNIMMSVSKETGIKLNSLDFYLEELKDRRVFLEEEFKWLYAKGYDTYNNSKLYHATLKEIVKKINNGGIVVRLKRFNKDQKEILNINTEEDFGNYFKRLELIDSYEDLFEDRKACYEREKRELERKGEYRKNPMIVKNLKYHQKTRFKRQYFHNPKGLRNIVLKREIESKEGVKSDWYVNRNTLKY